MKLLSRAEELVLLAIWHLGDNAYGVTIRRYLMEVTDEHWSLAAVYVPLDRFEKQGHLTASKGPSAPGRAGAVIRSPRRATPQLWLAPGPSPPRFRIWPRP